MKNIAFLIPAFLIIALFAQSCKDPQPPECKLTTIKNSGSDTVACSVEIVKDNGCKYFSEQGIVYGLHDNLYHYDSNAVVTVVKKATKDRTFSFSFVATVKDTTYYIRAYIKSDYGTGYSNTQQIQTSAPETAK